MGVNKTSLSAGLIIRDILVNNAAIKALTTKIFPVTTDKALLPYIVYRRASLDKVPIKQQVHGFGHYGPSADTIAVEVDCYAATNALSLDLAEAVRAALDGANYTLNGLVMRSCFLADSEETWQDDAYIQRLVFQIKI